MRAGVIEPAPTEAGTVAAAVSPETFAQLARHHSEREICEIVFLVASEHLYNVKDLGLNIGSAGMCEARTAEQEPVTAYLEPTHRVQVTHDITERP